MFLFSVCASICGCGSGESGCSACGCCKACARELDGQEARQRGIFDAVKEMIPLDLLLGIYPLTALHPKYCYAQQIQHTDTHVLPWFNRLCSNSMCRIQWLQLRMLRQSSHVLVQILLN